MKDMTGRERLLAALHGQETDRMPFAPLIDDYFISSLGQQGYPQDILGAMRLIGNDIMERHVGMVKSEWANVDRRREEKNGMFRDVYETPVGRVYQEERPVGNTMFASKHLIQTIEDVKVYQYMVEHTRLTPREQAFQERDREIGDHGIPTMSGPMCPLQEMLQHLAGVENTVYLLADYPEEMEEVFAAMHERNKRTYQLLAGYPGEVVFDYEDTSTTVMSRSMYVNYTMPCVDDYADIMHRAGKLFIAHMCGKLTGFIQEIGKGRMDGIDSVCPPTTGDLCSWDARQAWGEGKVVIGGIEPPALARMDVAECLAYVAEIIERLPFAPGFVLSSGDAVPYGTPMENLMAIAEYIRLLGARGLRRDAGRELIPGLVERYGKQGGR